MADLSAGQASTLRRAWQRALDKGWVFEACARFGEGLARGLLPGDEPRSSSADAARLANLLVQAEDDLCKQWDSERKHLQQMMDSGGSRLLYEELVACLTILSELALVKRCLEHFDIRHLRLPEPSPDAEVRHFLRSNRDAYPSAFSHALPPLCEHWWWDKAEILRR